MEPKHASVEEVADNGADLEIIEPFRSESETSSCTSSGSSVVDLGEEPDIEEIVREAPLCRQDSASEVARSLWGVVPPKNFGRVADGIFRSSYPRAESIGFLKSLKLKSIVTLVTESFPESHSKFVEEQGIQHFRIGIEPNKNPFVTISQCSMSAVLGVILNPANHPVLVHCNKGKHRTGCVVGCFRKLLGWDIADIVNEYHHYAGVKARRLDERYIELFNKGGMLWLARQNHFVPPIEPILDSPITTLAVGSRLRG